MRLKTIACRPGPVMALNSVLVAMVTRVTQGHSGRPLEMGRIPWLCFWLLQGVVLLRNEGEVLPLGVHDEVAVFGRVQCD